MQPEQILELVYRGTPQPGWAIYRYNIKSGISRIIWFGIYSIIAAITAFGLMLGVKKEGNIMLVFSAVMGLLSLLLLLMAVLPIFELFRASQSVIVFTESGIVKRFKNKTEYFPYDVITGVRFTNPYSSNMPVIFRRSQQYIDFTDSRTGKMINLTRNRLFGPPELINNFLHTKVSSGFVTTNNIYQPS